MSLDNAFWKTGIASNMNAASMVSKFVMWFIWKHNLVPISLSGFVLRGHCTRSRWRLAVRGILYEDILAHSSWCSKRWRIDEAVISTTVAVHQRAANSQEEAVWTFTAKRSKCRPLRIVLTFLQLSSASFSSCSMLIRPPLPNLIHCAFVPLRTLYYCSTGKSSFSTADNPLPFKLHKLLEFLLLRPWRHT